jgi:hypothetical protein
MRIIVLFCFIILSFCGYSQIDYIEKSEKLKEYFDKAQNDPDSNHYKVLFFNEFPDSFEEFSELYDNKKLLRGLFFGL